VARRAGDGWRATSRVGDLVLVCDVGGGTTDFSLIAVSERDGELALERVAVGEHILLGGDNMDLALARLLQQRLEAAGPPHRHRAAAHAVAPGRLAKEALLERSRPRANAPITLLGRGSKLVGGTIKTTLTLDDVNQVLLDGFFPVVGRASAMPARQRASGSRNWACPTRPMRR
jgi:molecular chaperone DnaK (HSP70)